jgi:hypothetical protein
MRGALALFLAITLALAPACSFLTVRGAPSNDPGVRPVDCTQSRFAPIVDTVPAVVLLGIALAALADVSETGEGEEGQALVGGLVVIVFGLPGLPFAASAFYGYRKTGRCRDMNRRPLPQPPPPLIPMPAPAPSGPPGA